MDFSSFARLGAFLLVTLFSWPVAAETLASSAKSPPAEARERYREARAAFDAGDYELAIRLFVEADRLAPSAALSFNVARSYEKLGQPARALDHYRRYLRREPTGTGANRAAARVAELEAELARRGVQQITIDSRPAGAKVEVDQRVLGVTPWTGELTPGDHTLVVTHAGFAKATRVITVTPDRAFELEMTLEPQAAASVVAASPPHEPSFKERVGPWPFVTLGASAVAFGIAGAYELERSDAAAAARASRTQLEYAMHRDDAESRQTTARVFAGVGGGLALIGGVWLGVSLLDDSPPKRDQSSARVWIDCGTTACTAHLRERF